MTAVEYLISMVKSPEWQDMYIWHKEEVFKTALAMEKEQMFAYTKNRQVIGEYSQKFFEDDFEEYYNKTFKQD